MYDHITIIKHEPAFLGLSLDASFFLVILFGFFQHAFGKRVQHAVAGAVANHEIICEGRDVLDVQKQDVFALFVLQGGDDFVCKFECVQLSPHKVRINDLSRHCFSAARKTTACKPSLLVSSRYYTSAPSLLWLCQESQSAFLRARGGSFADRMPKYSA